jgi:hypothetical protein
MALALESMILELTALILWLEEAWLLMLVVMLLAQQCSLMMDFALLGRMQLLQLLFSSPAHCVTVSSPYLDRRLILLTVFLDGVCVGYLPLSQTLPHSSRVLERLRRHC